MSTCAFTWILPVRFSRELLTARSKILSEIRSSLPAPRFEQHRFSAATTALSQVQSGNTNGTGPAADPTAAYFPPSGTRIAQSTSDCPRRIAPAAKNAGHGRHVIGVARLARSSSSKPNCSIVPCLIGRPLSPPKRVGRPIRDMLASGRSGLPRFSHVSVRLWFPAA